MEAAVTEERVGTNTALETSVYSPTPASGRWLTPRQAGIQDLSSPFVGNVGTQPILLSA